MVGSVHIVGGHAAGRAAGQALGAGTPASSGGFDVALLLALLGGQLDTAPDEPTEGKAEASSPGTVTDPTVAAVAGAIGAAAAQVPATQPGAPPTATATTAATAVPSASVAATGDDVAPVFVPKTDAAKPETDVPPPATAKTPHPAARPVAVEPAPAGDDVPVTPPPVNGATVHADPSAAVAPTTAANATSASPDAAVEDGVAPVNATDRVHPADANATARSATALTSAPAAVARPGGAQESGVGSDTGERPPAHRASVEPVAHAASEPSQPAVAPPPAHETRAEADAVRFTTPAPTGDQAARDVERLVRLDALRPSAVHDAGDMRLEVTPAGLGRIEVHVSVRADAVQASLYANQDHARAALETHRGTLEAALGRSNLRLEGFTVGLGEHQRGEQGEPSPNRSPGAGTPITPIAAATAASTAIRLGAGGLSLRA